MVVQRAVASVPKRIPCVLAKHKCTYVNTGMDMDSTTAVRIFVLALPYSLHNQYLVMSAYWQMLIARWHPRDREYALETNFWPRGYRELGDET